MVQQTIQQIMTQPMNLPKPRPKLLMSTKINQRNITEERNDENMTGGSAAENTALLSKYRRILNENPDQEVDIQFGCPYDIDYIGLYLQVPTVQVFDLNAWTP